MINEYLSKKVELALLGYSVVSESQFDHWHEHNYWQAEFPMLGQSRMEFDKHSEHISAGDILLIPPQVRHSFQYNAETFATWSLKFKLHNFSGKIEPRLLKTDPVTEAISSLLNTTMRHYLPQTSLTSTIEPMHPKYFTRVVIIEHLLAGVISLVYGSRSSDNFIPGKRISAMIAARHGGNITVEEAAKKLGYTRGHVSLIFKQHYGMSLKRFIDRERVETAKRMLEYSDMNIGEIGNVMGFSDIFSFSIFFKRLTGMPPSHYINSKKMTRAGRT